MSRLLVLSGAAVLAALPGSAIAANARSPYRNVDRRVDAGNDTGDSRVESLNQQQLNRNGAPGQVGVAAPAGVAPGGPVYSYLPPAGYAPAPPVVVYAAPRPVVVAPYPVYGYYRPYRYFYPY